MRKYRIRNDPTPDVLRQSLIEGYCWWCKRGGFKSVANHTSHAHGITALEIRNLCGKTKADSIATPEYSKYCKTRPQTLKGYENMLNSNKHPDRPRNYTVEGLCRKRESIKKALKKFKELGIISCPDGNPEVLKLERIRHQKRLQSDPSYYQMWRTSLASTGRDKRIIAYCPICNKPFRKYATTNRKSCGNPECKHILRANILRANILKKQGA